MTISINITGETVEVVQRKLQDMAAALSGVQVTGVYTPPTADKLIAKGKEITAAAAETKKSKSDAPAQSAASESKPAEPKADAGTTAEVIEYKTIGDMINLKAKTNKEQVIALLAKYEAKRGTELKVEQYAGFLAELKEVA